ncbi:unnamed protein product, partial [Anisakis simplex]
MGVSSNVGGIGMSGSFGYGVYQHPAFVHCQANNNNHNNNCSSSNNNLMQQQMQLQRQMNYMAVPPPPPPPQSLRMNCAAGGMQSSPTILIPANNMSSPSISSQKRSALKQPSLPSNMNYYSNVAFNNMNMAAMNNSYVNMIEHQQQQQ